METYNGHRSWNAWNVALWISNTESIYGFAIACIARARNYYEGKKWASDTFILRRATLAFIREYKGERTPDGAKYNHLAVKLALEDFLKA